MSARDPNDVLTKGEVATSFFAAHDRLRERMREALAAGQLAGYRGYVDVHFFAPFGPVSPGTQLYMSVVPLDETEVAKDPPFGWIRYEISASKQIKAVARGLGDA